MTSHRTPRIACLATLTLFNARTLHASLLLVSQTRVVPLRSERATWPVDAVSFAVSDGSARRIVTIDAFHGSVAKMQPVRAT